MRCREVDAAFLALVSYYAASSGVFDAFFCLAAIASIKLRQHSCRVGESQQCCVYPDQFAHAFKHWDGVQITTNR